MPGEDELVTHLVERRGFCALLGNEPLEMLVAWLQHADIVVGSHGGALMNVMFLDVARRPAVVEFDGYDRPALFWLNTVALGLRYGWMWYNATGPAVSVHRVEELIAKVQPGALVK
jgi:hypothetical protein